MESVEATQAPVKKHSCNRPCCQCKPIRIMRNQCLANNPDDESACQDFINAFKLCIETRKAEAAAKKAQNHNLLL